MTVKGIMGFVWLALAIFFAWFLYDRDVTQQAEFDKIDQEAERELAALDARELRYCKSDPVYRDMYREDCELEEKLGKEKVDAALADYRTESNEQTKRLLEETKN